MSHTDVDVLIIGAGLSGIGAAWHLQDKCPGKTYAILERREAIGGTWDLFRYPGIRSDSDMHTLGYSFKPWTDAKAIADGPSIREYVRETAEEAGIDRHIRFSHTMTRAEWKSDDAAWHVTATRSDTGEEVTVTCNMLLMCAGYYSYREGHKPEFPGEADFRGRIVHPQLWPEDLDYKDQKVVVIGSGATAMTLVPAMADEAGHVTMLQRTPTYVVARPDQDVIANNLRRVLPDSWAYDITRAKNVGFQSFFYKQTRKKPEKAKERLLGMAKEALGEDMVETHFTPPYNPWDQRLCLIPNGDLYEAINNGSASVVTDHIARFTETGIKLESGEHLEADVIITATGLKLVVLGEADFVVDGEAVDFSQTFTYLGMGYSGVPNLISTFGYINASWTLRADLVAEYACRMINHMDETGMRQATPKLREEDRDMPARDCIEGFPAGYMQRAMPLMPRQGDRVPWINPQDYKREKKLFRSRDLDDGVMVFSNPGAGASGQDEERAAPDAVAAE
ncbi:MAG: FAD-dependent oxidoreductase [Alphaproteobacteria bacterium]|jgi:cation diffusion facilitator CzcD-associated flavoprotein CzcO|nr:FAD-dependent oxidoreductase [Alphaproteobacteria bacterium]